MCAIVLLEEGQIGVTYRIYLPLLNSENRYCKSFMIYSYAVIKASILVSSHWVSLSNHTLSLQKQKLVGFTVKAVEPCDIGT